MTSPCDQIDPYAELDNRADAGELSEEKRRTVSSARRRAAVAADFPVAPRDRPRG